MSSVTPHTRRLLIEAMARHLPPSGSALQLWDVGGRTAAVLADLRGDLHITAVDPDTAQWPNVANAADGIVAYDYDIAANRALLTAALKALRPGGRLIAVTTCGEPDKQAVRQLEDAGHTRILVEIALDGPEPMGVLLRGEKPHTTQSTFARIKVAANADQDNLTLDQFDGPYVYLLVRQSPNKPVWALRDDEQTTWQAVTASKNGETALVGFTSLPKAVSLMQPAVMQNIIADVNKVGKFSRATALTWDLPLWLNPTLEALKSQQIDTVPVDPNTAEAPDE